MSQTRKAINWDSVSLLHGAHFRAETEYLEEAGWQSAREWPWGLVRLTPNSLVVAGSPEQDHEVVLTDCTAVTSEGRLIRIGADRQARLLHTIVWGQHRDDLLFVYVGISRRKQAAQTPPAVQDAGLIECEFLEYRHELTVSASAPASADYDWVPIGQLRRDVHTYRVNENYIPECVSLRSHALLIGQVKNIARKSKECVLALRQHQAGRPLAVGMTVGLVPVQVFVDQSIHPRAYLDRAATTLRTLQALTDCLPPGDRQSREYAHFQAAMDGALRGVEAIEQRDLSPPNWYSALESVYRALSTFLIYIPFWRGEAPTPQPIYTPPPPPEPRPQRQDAEWAVGEPPRRGNSSGPNNPITPF